MGPSNNNSACTRKEMLKKIRKVLDQMDDAKVDARCCCTNVENPGPGKKVVMTSCLDGAPGVTRVVPVNPDKYIWIPPQVDTRPPLDPTMSCYAATVANQFYDQWKGCRLECAEGASKGKGAADGAPGGPHSHWWNEPKGAVADAHHQGGKGGKGSKGGKGGKDHCEDSAFVAPEPLGRMAWSDEPGGTCRHPQYCKAHCFDHIPERDWARS